MVISKEELLGPLTAYGRNLGEKGNVRTLVALLIKNLEAEKFQSCLDDESRREALFRAVLSLNKNLAQA